MRYIVFDVKGHGSAEAIEKSVQGTLGTLATAVAECKILEFERNVGLIKTNTRSLTAVRAALCLVTELNGVKIRVHVRGVSGTIRAARRFMLQR